MFKKIISQIISKIKPGKFEFTPEEIMSQFPKVFAQSMNYTKKMQALAPYRKSISALEEEGMSAEDLNLMIDAFKGNKDAIAEVLKRTDVDVLDLETEEDSEYVPKSYGRDEAEIAIGEVVDRISRDPEFAVTEKVLGNEWDDRSRQAFVERPELIEVLHEEVKKGAFAKVSPMAAKLKVYDGGRKSDLEYYLEAEKQYYAEQVLAASRQQELDNIAREKEALAAEAARLEAVKVEANKRERTQSLSSKKKAAATTKSRAGRKTVTNYLDDSDESFEKWYKELQEKY